MKARYQSFLFIALLFFAKESFSQSDNLDLELSANEDSKNTEKSEQTTQKSDDQLQYDDMPFLPSDQISEGQSATAHEPTKKLRFRSLSPENLEVEKETRTRQR